MRKNYNIFISAIILSFLFFLTLHYGYNKFNDYNIKVEAGNTQDQSKFNVQSEDEAHYLNDNALLSSNPYQGDPTVKAELLAKIQNYSEVRNFQAFDYSNARTKGDIIPDYKNYLEINYATETSGLKGDISVTYSMNGKIKLKTYSTASDGKLYLDAGFLATFLDSKNRKLFVNDLSSKNMDLNSFVSARIEHGKHTFDNMNPNYFSSLAYLNRMRTELDTLNYENITKLDENRYELTNTNATQLPLMIGYQVLRYKSILTFTSPTAFTLERKANKLTYFKVDFHTRPNFKPMPLPTFDIDELEYNDNFVSPDITM